MNASSEFDPISNKHTRDLIFPNHTVRYLKQWVIVDDDDDGDGDEENNTLANIIYEFLKYAMHLTCYCNSDAPSD